MKKEQKKGKCNAAPRRIAVYCRVSTLAEEQELSFETQCAYYRSRIAADPGLTLVDIYSDRGISGLFADKRAEFTRMMADCLAGKADEVWTKSVSRFARNLRDCITCVRQLKDRGVAVVFEKEAINSMDPHSEMLLSLLAACAQEESNSMSMNMRWANDQRNRRGTPSQRASYGYRRAPGSRACAWEIHTAEAARVREIFRLAARGTKYVEMIAALDRMEQTAAAAKKWSRRRIQTIIQNEVYIGDILTNKYYNPDYLSRKTVVNRGERPQYYIEGHHEPLVDRETFEQANRMLRSGALRSARRKKISSGADS